VQLARVGWERKPTLILAPAKFAVAISGEDCLFFYKFSPAEFCEAVGPCAQKPGAGRSAHLCSELSPGSPPNQCRDTGGLSICRLKLLHDRRAHADADDIHACCVRLTRTVIVVVIATTNGVKYQWAKLRPNFTRSGPICGTASIDRSAVIAPLRGAANTAGAATAGHGRGRQNADHIRAHLASVAVKIFGASLLALADRFDADTSRSRLTIVAVSDSVTTANWRIEIIAYLRNRLAGAGFVGESTGARNIAEFIRGTRVADAPTAAAGRGRTNAVFANFAL